MSETVAGGAPKFPAGEEKRESMAADTATAGRQTNRKLMIAGGAALILIAGGGAALLEKGNLFRAVESDVAKDTKLAKGVLHRPILLGIPPIVSNLDNGDGRPVYVKLTAKVEISGARDETALQTTIPEIQDIFQTYLHETRPEDIRGNGIYRLREAILRRLRAELAPLEVTNLYLVEFLVQ